MYAGNSLDDPAQRRHPHLALRHTGNSKSASGARGIIRVTSAWQKRPSIFPNPPAKDMCLRMLTWSGVRNLPMRAGGPRAQLTSNGTRAPSEDGARRRSLYRTPCTWQALVAPCLFSPHRRPPPPTCVGSPCGDAGMRPEARHFCCMCARPPPAHIHRHPFL